MATPHKPNGYRYPAELRERAIRMVRETIAESGERHGAIARVSRQLGVSSQSLGTWVRQADIDQGLRPGTSTTDRQRIVELERENRELRRANEILKAASAFFVRELDPRCRRS